MTYELKDLNLNLNELGDKSAKAFEIALLQRKRPIKLSLANNKITSQKIPEKATANRDLINLLPSEPQKDPKMLEAARELREQESTIKEQYVKDFGRFESEKKETDLWLETQSKVLEQMQSVIDKIEGEMNAVKRERTKCMTKHDIVFREANKKYTDFKEQVDCIEAKGIYFYKLLVIELRIGVKGKREMNALVLKNLSDTLRVQKFAMEKNKKECEEKDEWIKNEKALMRKKAKAIEAELLVS